MTIAKGFPMKIEAKTQKGEGGAQNSTKPLVFRRLRDLLFVAYEHPDHPAFAGRPAVTYERLMSGLALLGKVEHEARLEGVSVSVDNLWERLELAYRAEVVVA
jgi:hypothetical protein